MSSTDIIAGVNVLLGLILLFFGARFVRLTIGAYGAIIGLVLGSMLVSNLALSGVVELLIVIALAVVLAIIAVRFYKFLVRASIGIFAFNLSYALLREFDVATLIALVSAVAIGLVVFVLVKVLKLVDQLFIFITATQGAATLLAGIAILTTHQTSDALQHGNISSLIQKSALWLAGWAVLAIAGMVVQGRSGHHSSKKHVDSTVAENQQEALSDDTEN